MHLIELCFLLWKESTSLQKLHIDGADFYANYKGWKSFKGMSFEKYPSQAEFSASFSP